MRVSHVIFHLIYFSQVTFMGFVFNGRVLLDTGNVNAHLICTVTCWRESGAYVLKNSVSLLFNFSQMTFSEFSKFSESWQNPWAEMMITRDILHLTTDKFLDVVVKTNFPGLSVGWYLVRVVSVNRYLIRSSNPNALFY